MYLKPNYKWIVNDNKKFVKQISKQIFKLAQYNNYTSMRKLVTLTASFVQSIRYCLPKKRKFISNKGEFYTIGLYTPIETLYFGCGDCDSKCVLFASIIKNFPNPPKVKLFLTSNHAFIGVRGIPRKGELYISNYGIKYILIELTTFVPLGKVANKIWERCKNKKYKSIDLL